MSTIAFHRVARSYPERLPDDEIKIIMPQPPPQPNGGGVMAVLQFLLPAMGSLTSVLFYFTSPSKSSPLLLIGVGGMLVASLGSGILMRSMQNRQLKRQTKAYRQKYQRYLASLTTRLDDISQRQQAVGQRLNPAPAALGAVVAEGAALWERAITDDDFLRVRLGTGVVPLSTAVRVDVGSNPLADFDADLLAKAQALASKYAQLADAPITIGLRDQHAVTIQGTPEETRALARALISQIAVFHAPGDVRIMALCAPEQVAAWSWLKWLPHARCLRRVRAEDFGGAEPLCLLADTPDDALFLLQRQVVTEVERRRKLKDGAARGKRSVQKPHFIICVDDYTPKNPLAHLPPLEEWLRAEDDLGVTVICLVRNTFDEPPATQQRLAFNKGGWLTLSDTAYGGERYEFITPDAVDVADSEDLARRMTPLVLQDENSEAELAQDVRLLTLLDIPTAADLRLARTWQPRSRTDLLRVPIGIGSDGTPLLLDIRESAEGGMGPHGMVIGATGSGKSELLRTIVTSLAITHDPETLNFILADFKGGASFADLAQLPHAAGMITNLQSDLSQVDRMRAALFGEQERRQRLLRTSGNLDNIRQYHQQRLKQPEMEPLPYLMIIVDEFAELLTQRPDFLELFVAIGRVGRSLGMHMLLATQRLSEGRIQGLEGHLRYRICLRTFSASESSAVLGTPDAFYLPAFPGIGYFKVDTTIYKQFKTALVTVPVAAAAASIDTPPLRAFTNLGRLVALHAPAQSDQPADSLHTDMDAIIAQVHAQYQPTSEVHQVWLPPLDNQLTLRRTLDHDAPAHAADDALPTPVPGTLAVPLGLIDLPAEQAQRPFILDFSGANGHLALVGAPLAGKSVALQSLIMSLMVAYAPQDVQIYIVDLGGGSLRAFEDAPHVGAVCGTGERDTIRRLLRQVRSVIETRALILREQRLDDIGAFRARRQAGDRMDTPFGDVFLIIDNLGQLRTDIEDIDVEITELAATGLTYGVHVVVTANRWSDVRAKLRDTIGARLELRLNDPADSEMGKVAAQSLLQASAGRGVIKGGAQFQVALPSIERDGTTGRGAIDRCISAVRARWPGEAAPPLRLLPQVYPQRDLPPPEAHAPGEILIGIDEFQLDPVAIDLTTMGPHFMIYGDGESGKTNLLRLWIQALTRQQTPDKVRFALIDNRRTLLDCIDAPHLLAYACTQPMLKDLIEKLRAAVEPRLLSGAMLTLEELRKPRRWEGPRYVLFIDDYETLTTATGNPLTPLGEIIAQAKDIGFHLVLARKVTGASRSSMDQVAQRLKELATPALILRGDPQEGALVGTQRAAQLPTGRGFLVRRNQRTMLVQTALLAAVPTPDEQKG